ncbi:unnamed protein product [Closterium sp. NIES-53]
MSHHLPLLPGMADDGPLGVAGAYDDALMPSAADRQSHWGFHETKELIALRAEMEREFVPARTSNHVWETISLRMKEKGYRRTPNQCKCKWKVLVNRYKVPAAQRPPHYGNKELSADGSRSCPFFDELDAIFKQRALSMDRLLVQAEGGGTPGGIGATSGVGSGFSAGGGRAGAVGGTLGTRGSFGGKLGARGGAGGVGGGLLTRRARDEEEEEEEDEEEGDDDLEDELNVVRNKRRKRDFNAGARKAATGPYGAGSPGMGKGASASAGGGAGGDAFDGVGGAGNGGGDRRAVLERQRAGSMQEVLEQFFVQQLRLEQEWREAIERREAERRVREGEWRSRLEALERDRAQRESMWRQVGVVRWGGPGACGGVCEEGVRSRWRGTGHSASPCGGRWVWGVGAGGFVGERGRGRLGGFVGGQVVLGVAGGSPIPSAASLAPAALFPNEAFHPFLPCTCVYVCDCVCLRASVCMLQMEAERAGREDERAARRDQLIIALITKLSAPPAPPPAAPAPSAPPATTPPAAPGTVAADTAAAAEAAATDVISSAARGAEGAGTVGDKGNAGNAAGGGGAGRAEGGGGGEMDGVGAVQTDGAMGGLPEGQSAAQPVAV